MGGSAYMKFGSNKSYVYILNRNWAQLGGEWNENAIYVHGYDMQKKTACNSVTSLLTYIKLTSQPFRGPQRCDPDPFDFPNFPMTPPKMASIAHLALSSSYPRSLFIYACPHSPLPLLGACMCNSAKAPRVGIYARVSIV